MPEWDFLCPPGTPFVSCEVLGKVRSNEKPHSFFSFNQPVSRKMGYYLTNVVPLYFIIVAFGWNSFANDPTDNANRFNALVALLLTSTAFKYVYKETLPRVHYLTRLDYYMYIQLVFLLVQGLMHALASLALELWGFTVQEVREMEFWGLVTMAMLWVFGHLFLVNWAKGHRSLLDLEAPELLDHLQDIERSDLDAEKMRRRGIFSSSWWTSTRKRARTKSEAGESGQVVKYRAEKTRFGCIDGWLISILV